MRRWFKKARQAAARKKTGTAYALELLESRVLLSAEFAGALQAMPVKPAEVPQQAVILNVPAAPAAAQQAFSVSEMLAKSASFFPQRSNELSEDTSHTNVVPPAPVGVSPSAASETAQPVSEILASSTQDPSNSASLTQPTALTSSLSQIQAPSVSKPIMTSVQNDVSSLAPGGQTLTGSMQTVSTSPDQQTQSSQLVSQTSVTSSSTPSVPISGSTNSLLTTSDAINPQLPQLSVDTSMPSTSLTVRVGPHGDYTNLQDALDSVPLGTTILLQPGVSYTSPNDLGFILPNKTTGTGWIVIRPDVADSSLPAPGTRITPADSAMMPKILRGDVNNYAISAAPGAHNYRIVGVEFMNQGNVDTPYSDAFVNLDGGESSVSAQSNHIILDRAYIHGPSAPGSVGVKFGVLLGGQYQAVIDSTIEGLHSNDGEAKAIAGWDGAGLWLIRNNFLSASGENIMIGGATPIISGLTPSDIEITHNHFYKPLAWRDDPAYTSGLNRVVTKNLLELKNAERVLIEANVFENVWPDGQSGHAVVLTPRGGGSTGSDPWTTVSDITIRNNKFLDVANGFGISGGGPTISLDQGGPTQRGGRILVENNVFMGLGGDYGSNDLSGNFATIGMGPSDLQIKHNTVASYAGTTVQGTSLIFSYGIPDEGALFPLSHFVLQDNIFAARAYPMMLSAADNLNTLMPGFIWTNNVVAGPWPTSGGWTAAMMPQGNGNAYPSAESNVQYVNLMGSDYRLASTSPYVGAASDGKDIGVDWDLFNSVNS
jgi:hypothetical protein